MLGLQHRIVLEDHLGEKHTLHLLEIVADRFFILLPPSQADDLAGLQATAETICDDAIDILIDYLSVVSIREHRFLQMDEMPAVLAKSRHHILRLCGMRMIDELPPMANASAETLAHAFSEEIRRRRHW